MKVTVKAPAKINLSLDVLGRRPDGYHEISTVMQAVSLYDSVTVSRNDSGKVTVFCAYDGVPNDDTNIVAKAAYRFFDYCRLEPQGVHIEIDKQIPTQAGLAGGSGDGAAAILALNLLFDARLTPADMNAIGERVGADVPFCIEGGTKLCTGTGTSLKKLPRFRCESIVICKPDAVSVSTAEAYQKVDALPKHPCYTDEMIKALYSRDLFMITSTIFNDFELALQIPQVSEIKKIMLECKAKGAGMSGSGSAVFGVFDSRRKAEKCCEKLRQSFPQTFLCKPVNTGCEVVSN
ncbi:MAG TPA: 4-(cytidine 5'-diphospho)-2-C-methyl-D-erythritol kinase [Ruminococcaceae bacterium]|nr:4-(cytidine 5'-diphospho)-2-C-methyl-D-erythritol kinase [Oscillospiraceae bacterium]